MIEAGGNETTRTDHLDDRRKASLSNIALPRMALAALAIIGAVKTADASDAIAGRAIFISTCSSCHGLDGIGTLEYVPSFSKCEGLGKDNATLRVSVRDGIGGRMPPWGVYLSEREIDDAIAYARSFCKL
jgi:mono/diheme cytochrome c family protein